MEAKHTPTAITDDELLAGGARAGVLVRLDREGNVGYAEQRAFVRLVPVREYGQLREVLLDECRMIELVCGQAQGWADTLHPDSHELLVAEINRINHHFFVRWLPRRLETEEQFRSGATDQFMAAAARELAAELAKGSSRGSPTSPPAQGGIKHPSPR